MYPWCGEGSGHSCQNGEVFCVFQMPCKLVLALQEEQGFAVSFSFFAQFLSCGWSWVLSPSQRLCHPLSSSDFLLRLSPPLNSVLSSMTTGQLLALLSLRLGEC